MLPPKSILQLARARSFRAQRLVPAKNPLSKFQAPRTLHRGFEFNPVFCRGSKPPIKTALFPATKNLSRFGGFDVMDTYWSLKSVPELAPLTRQQRRRVHEQCLQRHFFRARGTRRSVLAFVSALFIATVFLFLGASIPSSLGIPHSFWFFSDFGHGRFWTWPIRFV